MNNIAVIPLNCFRHRENTCPVLHDTRKAEMYQENQSQFHKGFLPAIRHLRTGMQYPLV